MTNDKQAIEYGCALVFSTGKAIRAATLTANKGIPRASLWVIIKDNVPGVTLDDFKRTIEVLISNGMIRDKDNLLSWITDEESNKLN